MSAEAVVYRGIRDLHRKGFLWVPRGAIEAIFAMGPKDTALRQTLTRLVRRGLLCSRQSPSVPGQREYMVAPPETG